MTAPQNVLPFNLVFVIFNKEQITVVLTSHDIKLSPYEVLYTTKQTICVHAHTHHGTHDVREEEREEAV